MVIEKERNRIELIGSKILSKREKEIRNSKLVDGIYQNVKTVNSHRWAQFYLIERKHQKHSAKRAWVSKYSLSSRSISATWDLLGLINKTL